MSTLLKAFLAAMLAAATIPLAATAVFGTDEDDGEPAPEPTWVCVGNPPDQICVP